MRLRTIAAAGCALLVILACVAGAGMAQTAYSTNAKKSSGGPKRPLIAVQTGRRGEIRKTVPIAKRAGRKTRSTLSLRLPRLKRGDRIRFNGEVTLSLTCVEQTSRCVGRSYDFDPHLRAQIVLAGGRNQSGRSTEPLSRPVELTCQQTRPNRNHHCPLVVKGGSLAVKNPKRLPCKPAKCRLNMLVDAYNEDATRKEVVVVGSDQPNGTVEAGKGRVSAAVQRRGSRVKTNVRKTRKRVNKKLEASFDKGKRVVYSQRLGHLKAGDVLLVRGRQRTRIRRYPYFISDQIVVATRRNATRSTSLTRRIVSRNGNATETNGFNCTLGPSAFRSPCRSSKAGLALIKRTPRTKGGRSKPLYVNLVSRGFPKLAQARGSYPPARILRGGRLTVRRLRDEPRRRRR